MSCSFINNGNSALFIQDILEIIFHNFKSYSKDLLNCRLVCRTWHGVASSKAEKLFKLTLKAEYDNIPEYRAKNDLSTNELSEDELNNYNNYRLNIIRECNPGIAKLDQYLSYLGSPSSTFRALRFAHCEFKQIPMKHPSVTQFFKDHGYSIRKLKLDLIVEEKVLSRREIHVTSIGGILMFSPHEEESIAPHTTDVLETETFRNILLQTPNLEEIVIYSFPSNVTSQGFLSHEHFNTSIKKITLVQVHNPHSDFMQDLIRCAPQLQGFYSSDSFSNSAVLSELQHGVCSNTLKELTLSKVNVKDLENIMHAEWKLTFLSISKIEPENGVDGLIVEFIRKQSATLKTLVVMYLGDLVAPQDYQMRLPDLPKLMCLHLRLSFGMLNTTCRPEPINFVKQFPNLIALHFDGWGKESLISNSFFSGINAQPHLKLLQLELPSTITVEEMEAAGRIFPNVKYLTVPYQRDESFKKIWENFTNVESLTLYVNRPFSLPLVRDDDEVHLGLDVILTGLSQKKCRMLRILNDPRNYSATTSQSSITNLIKLRQLCILPSPSRYDAMPRKKLDRITNASIWVLAQLNQLQYLELGVQNIDKEGEAILKECIPDVRLK